METSNYTEFRISSSSPIFRNTADGSIELGDALRNTDEYFHFFIVYDGYVYDNLTYNNPVPLDNFLDSLDSASGITSVSGPSGTHSNGLKNTGE